MKTKPFCKRGIIKPKTIPINDSKSIYDPSYKTKTEPDSGSRLSVDKLDTIWSLITNA